MKEIQLTQRQVALVDDEDFEWLSQWNWCALHRKTGGYYAVRNEKIIDMAGVSRKRKLVLMHREILSASDGMEVDHWNGNGLDNQKENLRECSHADNMKNQKINIRNRVGYKGVSWNEENQKYTSSINTMRKTVYLGSFDTAEDAARAYDRSAIEKFGKFARLNFPTS